MYTNQDERDVEVVCYNQDHIKKVLTLIRKNFDKYFDNFLEESGSLISKEKIEQIQEKFGISVKENHSKSKSKRFKEIIRIDIEEFEKDREKYETILDEEFLEESEEDLATFKSSTLKNECPIIHSTYYNKSAKELDKYRKEFDISDAKDLWIVIQNLYYFAQDYNDEFSDNDYDDIKNYKDLHISNLDTDDYTVYGVIGGGIKSHMLYKLYPRLFPNRSRYSIWALWYLTDKDVIDCIMDSEFLMIDLNKLITQQNYLYPYELFTFYAHQIYQMLRKKSDELNVGLDNEYRYVYVDSFLKSIAKQHQDEIDVLKKQIDNGGWSYV